MRREGETMKWEKTAAKSPEKNSMALADLTCRVLE